MAQENQSAPPERLVRPNMSSSKTKKDSRDELIMATNSSSIVSKRSVERLYYPHEPHFFRFFVKKFQRRAPLINRGYLLRLRAIDATVRRFLARETPRRKVVVNLGCGSDVLPWQCHTRYPQFCTGNLFVDVDYPDLMIKKRQIVHQTPELWSLIGEAELSDGLPLLLRSERYCQIGCDLRNIDILESSLFSIAPADASDFLFVAEVSITYMETEAADALIAWAGKLPNSEFCLLEQILPDGPGHPFAVTMLKHFLKLKTPLQSVQQYPTLEDQVARFRNLGYNSTDARSLWKAWADEDIVPSGERQRLDEVEPFDEWEELALFASHYILLSASNNTDGKAERAPVPRQIALAEVSEVLVPMHYTEHQSKNALRRYGGAMRLGGGVGEDFIVHFAGQGTSGRLKSCSVYRIGDHLADLQLQLQGPPSRVLFSLTDLGNFGVLLCGGRTSPSNLFQDSWRFNRGTNSWQRVHDLPVPLYRQSVVRLGSSPRALLLGGRSPMEFLTLYCLIFDPELGWVKCDISGSPPAPVLGAVVLPSGTSSESENVFHGILAGGILPDGAMNHKVYSWELRIQQQSKSVDAPTITFAELDRVQMSPIAVDLICRFGAVTAQVGRYTILAGGVIKDQLLPRRCDMLLLSISNASFTIAGSIRGSILDSGANVPSPLIIGANLLASPDGQISILGGGATCFSMGTFWTSGTYSFKVYYKDPLTMNPGYSVHPDYLCHYRSFEIEAVESGSPLPGTDKENLIITAVPKVKITSEGDFCHILQQKKPVIIEGLDIGRCVEKWTVNHLVDAIGQDTKIVVHEATTRNMSFKDKNFGYVTKTFGNFMDDVQNGRHIYLRSLSSIQPASMPAALDVDFPSLSGDFKLPPELSGVSNNVFSSVLRISGPVNMWLHYDVMANMYCQVSGTKRLILFPPSDVTHLAFDAGASSSSIDVFTALEDRNSAMRLTRPQEASLGPGDALFLPPLWPHAATPISNMSVAVNVFFRDMKGAYASGRDVYGNRDLAAYEKGRLDIARISGHFDSLPQDARGFYIRRLADELLQLIHE